MAALGGTLRSIQRSTLRGGMENEVESSRISPRSSSLCTNSRVTPATPNPILARSTSRLRAPSSISGVSLMPRWRKYFSI